MDEKLIAILLAGAIEAVKPTVSGAIKDAYLALKALIARKFISTANALEEIEAHPDNQAYVQYADAKLIESGADKDQEVIALQTQLGAALKEAGVAPAVSIKDVKDSNIVAGSSVCGGITQTIDKSGRKSPTRGDSSDDKG
jgi:hypothetical protein